MTAKDLQVLGPFRLHRNARLLTLGGRPVALPAGAVDFLMELLVRPGEDLRSADPDRTGDAGSGAPVGLLDLAEALNLAFASASAPHFIAQVDEATFRFIGPVTEAAPTDHSGESLHGDLPPVAADLVRRPELLARGLERLQQARLVTLIGPGGVGKTTAALTVAWASRAQFSDGVRFVDLAPIRQGGVLGHAVLMALGTEPVHVDAGAASFERALGEALWNQQVLIVLDNCEHLVDEAAWVAELALRSKGVRVLATSREPLKTFGETLLPVGPMAVPPLGAMPDMATALRYDAVELFLARSPRVAGGEEKLAGELNVVYEVCRRLDGIPLALELAAAHVASLGLEGLKQRLALWPIESLGTERATSRHKTLEAALDWSYNLLAEPEKVALRRLAVFRGDFPFESALDLISLGGHDIAEPTGALLGLQAKSLLQVRSAHETVQYRLLETTRDYAIERLRDAPEEPAVRRQHAIDCGRRLQKAEQEFSSMSGKGWLARHGRLIDDVRHAVSWGLGSSGDVEAAAELVIQTLPLTGRLALFDEAHDWLSKALEAVCKVDRPACRKYELRLLVSFRGMAAHTKRSFADLPGSDERILELVETAGDDRDAAGACMSVWFATMNRAHYANAAAASERFIAIAERTGSTVEQVEAYKVASYAFHFLGHQHKAHAHAMRVLELAPNNVASNYYLVVGCDARVSVRIVEARALWIFGRFEEAAQLAQVAFQMALEDRPLAVCLVLSYVACPMALWNGDFERARESVGLLREWSTRHDLKPHQDWARWYALIIQHRCALKRSDLPPDMEPPDAMQADMFATLGCDWLVAQTAERVAAGHMGWSAPEIHRREAELLLLGGQPDAARQKFLEAIQVAQAGGAAGWELRAVISLAELEAGDGRYESATRLLGSLQGRVDLGYRTADTAKAARLLQAYAAGGA